MDRHLPTGTLTLLFSDIEGSTQLLSRLGAQYATVLSAQRSMMRAAFARWRGIEMGTEGDSFFVVFKAVGDALNAAVEAQRALRSHDWPAGAGVRVRMGMHTGEPMQHEDGYVGMDVHRAARVAASAHGGQVILSEASHQIASSQPPQAAQFLDLGWHRLKDLPQLERLYQVLAPGLQRDFPPLKTLGTPLNLPLPPTPLVGRDGELAKLTEVLTSTGARLLTLTGPGGSGKTRLALAAATALNGRFHDGLYFVPLESVKTTDVMWSTIAEVLGLPSEERSPTPMLEQLSTRSLLLVLDNLEQIPEASQVVQDLLGAAPGLAVIATSRRPLHLAAEFEHPVPPLELPPGIVTAVTDAAGYSAVQLFIQRAQMVKPSFQLTEMTVADALELCRRLDGLPLAIELAASRVKLLSPRALRARLDSSLDLSTRELGRPARQQTLRDTIAWSYDLLSSRSQRFFRRLGVFSGPADLAAINAVVGVGDAPDDPSGDMDPLDEVAGLVDASLATVLDGPDGEPRVSLLQTVAAYSLDRLTDAGELGILRRRHAEHYLRVVQALAPQLRSSQYILARDRLEGELDNVRAALGWTMRTEQPHDGLSRHEVLIGLRLCEALGWFWYAHGYQAEGRRWLDQAVAVGQGLESADLMTVLHSLAVFMLQHGEVNHGRDVLQDCLAFWRQQGDVSRLTMELNSLAVANRELDRPAEARKLLQECIDLARGAGERGRLANALSTLAVIETDGQSPQRAIELLHEALALDAELGDPWAEAVDHLNLAAALLASGRIAEAQATLAEQAPEAVVLGDIDLNIGVIELFAAVFAERGQALRAARLLGAAQAMRDKAEIPIPAQDAAFLERSISKVRELPSPQQWHRQLRVGGGYLVEDALAEATKGNRSK